jgi:hypothetical protein
LTYGHNADGSHPSFAIYAGTAGSTGAASANVTAWNTAIAADNTVFVPAGVYYINANLTITRSRVRVFGEPGAIFKLVPGTNVSLLAIGNLGSSPTLTDISVEGIEFDGSCVLQDIATTPGAVGTTDSTTASIVYSGQIAAVTNTTNATITVAGATWTVNQFAGLYLTTATGSTGAGASLQVTSNTANVLTLTGTFGTPPVAGDSFTIATGVYSRIVSTATNVTNATISINAANTWGTTRYVGMWLNVITGPAAGVSMPITAHTNSGVITVSGTFASPPVLHDLIQISTQPRYTSASWEAVFGSGGIVVRSCYRVSLRGNYVHDVWGFGIEINQSGSVSVQDNTVDNFGLQFVAGPGNGISCLGPGTTAAPSRSITFTNNRIRRVGDVGMDLHGNGSQGVVCANNAISARCVSTGGASTHWGISCEIEAADTVANIGTVITGNNIDDQIIGIAVANTGNNAQYFAAMSVTSNVITNSQVGIGLQGAHLNVSDNSLFNVGVGMTSNNDNAPGASIERDWLIKGNTVAIDPGRVVFGNSAIFLRWQALAASPTIATVTGATGNLVSPIVLTMSGGWTGTGQPVVGTIIVVVGVVGNTAANGAYVAQAVTSTSVTLANSVGNGAWSSGGTIQLCAHPLDSVTIVDNVFLGAGPGNTGSTHCGIYIEALSSGTANSSINHVTIGTNQIHGFNQGVSINSGAANAMVNGVEIRGVRIWNSNAWGILLAGTQIDTTVIENCELQGNVSGTISGQTAGALGNVVVIRNNRAHNPRGTLGLPMGSIVANPITTTVYTNDTGYDCTVFCSGTITAIALNGTTTGVTVGASASAVPIRVPIGATLALTGTSLAWIWVAD